MYHYNYILIELLSLYLSFKLYFKKIALAPIYFHFEEMGVVANSANLIVDYLDVFGIFLLTVYTLSKLNFFKNFVFFLKLSTFVPLVKNNVKKLFNFNTFFKSFKKGISYISNFFKK